MNSPLHILYILRASSATVKGGDTIQAYKTAEALRALGLRIDIRLCNEKNIDYSQYQLLHFFNIIRPADLLPHIQKSKLPYVVSTIFVDYTAYEQQDKSLKGRLLNFFNRDTKEYLKAVARLLVNGERIGSLQYILLGQKKSIQYILKNAAVLLPNSESEYQRLVKAYGVEKTYQVVCNSADTDLFNCTDASIDQKTPNMVLCVARIEGRKNQLNLIKALNNTAFELYLIGNPAPNHMAYYKACKLAAAANIHFISELSQNELAAYYQKAKVHVLPSWFETTGLSSLEALFSGCSLVLTKYGDTQEYFPEASHFYCDPYSHLSIRKAIEQAALNNPSIATIQAARAKYNWQNTATQTLLTYKKAIH